MSCHPATSRHVSWSGSPGEACRVFGRNRSICILATPPSDVSPPASQRNKKIRGEDDLFNHLIPWKSQQALSRDFRGAKYCTINTVPHMPIRVFTLSKCWFFVTSYSNKNVSVYRYSTILKVPVPHFQLISKCNEYLFFGSNSNAVIVQVLQVIFKQSSINRKINSVTSTGDNISCVHGP